jgi:GNAT superfamily N-acetyltransferase
LELLPLGRNMTQSRTLDDRSPLRIEPGTTADSYAVFMVFERSLADLIQRLGMTEPTSLADPEALARTWTLRQSMYEHLAVTADQFWLARRGDEVVGFARSIVRDGLRLLTEFFVLPNQQSSGLGRALLARALPAQETERRWLLATGDLRAQALYLKHGLYPHFPVYYLWRQPRQPAPLESDLVIEAVTPAAETVQAMGDIDARLLDFRRDVDHHWLMSDRQAYLYYRAGQPVGYGYVGHASGPFALLDTADFPAVLAHAEGQASGQGHSHFGLEVPMVNHRAVDFLLRGGFQINALMTQFMSDSPPGRLGNYIVTSPPFLL